MKITLDYDGTCGILVDGVVIDDMTAYLLLEQYGLADMDKRLALFADMVEIGARVLQRQQDGQQGDLLRREVERLEQTFSRAQRDLVSVAGRDFAEAVQRVFVEVGQHLSSIGGRLDGVLAVAAKEQELASERERGTAKGRPFEVAVADCVDRIARACGDSCDRTGDVGGISGRAGDVVVQVDGSQGPPKGMLVFEAKTGRLSKPEAMRELDRALAARGADFAVLVVAGVEKLPAATFELREYGGNKLIVSFDDASGDYGLELAYSLARARVLQRRAEVEGADVDGATKLIERAIQSLESTRQIKLKLTAIGQASADTKSLVDEMSGGVRDLLGRAQLALEASAPTERPVA